MRGFYRTGANHAHECCRPHSEIFKCPMYGTFNIQFPFLSILKYKPSIVHGIKRYWFLKIVEIATGKAYYGWAIRDKCSKQRVNTLEVVTKRLLPESLKKGSLEVEILPKWPAPMIKKWAANKYWFQTFPFSPIKRADSQLTWNAIDIIDWGGEDVLDWGCHYGYMSFRASEKGANVLGVDSNVNFLEMARTIRDHIIQQDVRFALKFDYEPKRFDVMLYLSVHHQRDLQYTSLIDTIKMLKVMTRKHVFIELILPPLFPKGNGMTEEEIDTIVGGTVLKRYRHTVRGYRKIYHLKINP